MSKYLYSATQSYCAGVGIPTQRYKNFYVDFEGPSMCRLSKKVRGKVKHVSTDLEGQKIYLKMILLQKNFKNC